MSRPVRVAGALELDLDRAAHRLAELVADELVRRGVCVMPAGPLAEHLVEPAPIQDTALREPGDDRPDGLR